MRQLFPADYLLWIVTDGAAYVGLGFPSGLWGLCRLAWRTGAPGHREEAVFTAVVLIPVAWAVGWLACALADPVGVRLVSPADREQTADYDDQFPPAG